MSFNPLWINTALKRSLQEALIYVVSIPYGLTLLSNSRIGDFFDSFVSIPYGLTLLSNIVFYLLLILSVSIPYGLTLLSNRIFY